MKWGYHPDANPYPIRNYHREKIEEENVNIEKYIFDLYIKPRFNRQWRKSICGMSDTKKAPKKALFNT